jgi:hypothetical protein
VGTRGRKKGKMNYEEKAREIRIIIEHHWGIREEEGNRKVAAALKEAVEERDLERGSLIERLKLIAETVERNRSYGVYTDDDWLIKTAREFQKALGGSDET